MNGNLNRLSDEWKDIKQVVLYGAGINASVIKNVFDKVSIDVKYVLDRDEKKQGTYWNGIPVVGYNQVKDEIKGTKIVIMTAHTAYNQISEFLTNEGLVEYRDYCGAGQFLCEWFWNVKQMNCIYHVDMTVVTRCTFKCKNCNMFIPYYKEYSEISFDELKNNVDEFYKRIDYVTYFGLIGGETLLCKHLVQILDYISTEYKGKFGRISFTTNGSILPSGEVIDCLKRNDVLLTISDYTQFIDYKARFKELISLLEENNVSYEIKYALEWVDFGFPENPVQRTDEENDYHINCCFPEWNGLNDGKFYYCNVSWSAEKSGRFKLKPSDYIVLKDIDENDKSECHKIVELSRGSSSFCRVCGGCGIDNTNVVPVGIQL